MYKQNFIQMNKIKFQKHDSSMENLASEQDCMQTYERIKLYFYGAHIF